METTFQNVICERQLCLFFRVGGSIPVIFSYYTEFLPKYRRGAMISGLATFWMAGNIIAAGNLYQTFIILYKIRIIIMEFKKDTFKILF